MAEALSTVAATRPLPLHVRHYHGTTVNTRLPKQTRVQRFMFYTMTCLTLCGTRSAAQTDPPLQHVPSPRIAVVLSGGTAKALADIGVFEVLEQMGVPIDAVTGTSMGAIVGGLYATGYSPRAIEDLVNAEHWGTFFERPTDRRLQRRFEQLEDERFTITFPLERGRPTLPAGALPRQSIAVHLDRYLWPVHDVTDFMQLPTPFGALVTDLTTGDAVLLRQGSLEQAIEGSAAVPGVFAPVRLADGRIVVDGAVNRNLPAEDARRLGADILICVDVSERVAPVNTLHSLVDVVDQTVSFRVQMSNAVQRPLCSVVIEPDINGLSSTDFAEADQWVRRGRVAARAHARELQAIADSARRLRGPPVPRRTIPSPDSVFVHRVLWSSVSPGADAIARGAITLRDDTWVTQRRAEATAARLFATGRFDQVSYRVSPRDGTHDLIFDLTEGDRDRLGIGMRYDTPRGAALLASARVADFLSPGSTASISARLGDIQQFEVRDVLGEGANAKFLQTYRATATRTPLRTVDVPGAVTSPELSVRQVAAQLEHTLVSDAVVSVEVSHEWSRDGAIGAGGPYALRARSFDLAAATVSRDHLDRANFPTSGTAFIWQSEVGTASLHARHSVARHIIEAQGALPITSRLSLLGSAYWGTVTGTNLPLHDWFFLGGNTPSAVLHSQFIPFLGLKPQSVVGQSVQVWQGGVQAQGPAGFIIALRGNVGNVFHTWPDSTSDAGYRSGMGLSVSRAFPPGPVSLSIASRSRRQPPVVEVTFGADF